MGKSLYPVNWEKLISTTVDTLRKTYFAENFRHTATKLGALKNLTTTKIILQKILGTQLQNWEHLIISLLQSSYCRKHGAHSYHTDDLDWIESSKNIEPKISIPLDSIIRMEMQSHNSTKVVWLSGLRRYLTWSWAHCIAGSNPAMVFSIFQQFLQFFQTLRANYPLWAKLGNRGT